MIISKNLIFIAPTLAAGDHIDACNLTQLNPHTVIASEVTGLVFTDCNLINCALPPDAQINRCNTAQISFCSHLHPDWIERGLPLCPEDCDHLIETTEVSIDGAVVAAERQYEDRVL